MTLSECTDQPVWHYALAGAWFIQMGVHEGMHAEVAFRRGDDTASLLGKRTINPLAHIEWSNPISWIVTVALPIYSALYWSFPIGMAWVPVNPARLKNGDRDHALVALAGPGGNILLCAVCLAVHFTILRWLPENQTTAAVEALFGAIYFTSIVYGIFNLTPIPPLDGSRVLYWLCPYGARRALDAIEPWGLWIVILLFRVEVVYLTFYAIVGHGTFLYR